jgi:hypothetical protein
MSTYTEAAKITNEGVKLGGTGYYIPRDNVGE